jgi:hypothetical protein
MAENTEVQAEYTEQDIESVVNSIYGEGEKGSEEVIQQAAAEEQAAEKETTPEPTQQVSDDLPPGFDPASSNTTETSEPDTELSSDDIDKAIEDAPNDSYKNNIVRMRKSLEANKQKIAEQSNLINKLQELEIINENGEIDTSKVGGDLKNELEAAYDKLGKINLMEDPRFIEKYGAPIQRQLTQISEIVKPLLDEDGDSNQLTLKIANMAPIERAKFMQENLPEEYRLVVTPYFAKIDEVVAERNAALAEHKKTNETLKREHTTQELRKIDEYRTAVKTKTTNEIISDGFDIFQRKEGNDEYNGFVDTLHQKADSVFASNDSEVQAKAMLLGVAAPVYRGMYEATEAKLAQALKEIENLKGARASFTGEGEAAGENHSKETLENTKNITKLLSNELNLMK